MVTGATRQLLALGAAARVTHRMYRQQAAQGAQAAQLNRQRIAAVQTEYSRDLGICMYVQCAAVRAEHAHSALGHALQIVSPELRLALAL